MSLTHHTLVDTLLVTRMTEGEIRGRFLAIHRGLLETSPYVRTANFTSIHPVDLEWLSQPMTIGSSRVWSGTR